MSDWRDLRWGAYDPVSTDGYLPSIPMRDGAAANTQKDSAYPGADRYPLPEGLRRTRKGPLNKSTGRRPLGRLLPPSPP